MTTRARVRTHVVLPVADGWEAAQAVDPAGPLISDDEIEPNRLDALAWIPARVPGTVAGALRDAGMEPGDLDSQGWWFRTTFEATPAEDDDELVLCFGGLATLAEVFLNGQLILRNHSMFATHAINVGALIRVRNELAIRFRALRPELAVQRRPRPRWRTRLVPDNNLRWFRTTLLGRIPSLSPGPAAVGPWRPIWLEQRRAFVVEQLAIHPRLDGDDGVVSVRGRLRALGGSQMEPVLLEVEGPSGQHRVAVQVTSSGAHHLLEGELRIPAVERWWPHTHGTPTTYTTRLLVGPDEIGVDAGRIGFRTLAHGASAAADLDHDGLSVHVNGVPVFARGALWMPLDIVRLMASESELRSALEAVVGAGMNMLRLPGFALYEQGAFHDLCDELGILVWQDLAFSSMDYPFDDDAFRDLVEDEVREIATGLAGRPSTAVLCGNSEVEQQVAMLGLDIGLARIPFFEVVVPKVAADVGLDAIYVPSSPHGGDLPLRPDRGVSHYYGVGGYWGPLSDARTSGVRFASECLAFANIPDDEALASLVPEPPGEAFTHHPRWKAGVVRDAGSPWDFDDMRDHYLGVIFGVDPLALRRDNWERYLALSRAVTGEVIAQVFGEWRRSGSVSNGGLILWLRDLVAGAGFGVVDNHGRPKVAYHHVRRIFAPTAVWLVNEGIGGVIAHVANDGAAPLSARLRVALYTDQELPVGQAEDLLELAPHATIERDIEAMLGHFVDASWAYRFGPPAQDVIVASLIRNDADGDELMSQSFHFPAGRPMSLEPERRLGLSATAAPDIDGTVALTVASRRLAYGVRIHVPGFAPSDDAFSVEPGGARTVALHPSRAGQPFAGGGITALNLTGRVAIKGADSRS
jgi:beta-mannosidase